MIRRFLVGVLIAAGATSVAGPASSAVAAPQELAFRVDSTADVSDAAPGDGKCATAEATCTLRAAMAEFGEVRRRELATTPLPEPSTLEVELSAGTFDVSSAPMPIAGAVVVRGAGEDQTVLDIGAGSRAFEVENGALSLEQLSVTGGRGAGAGGVVVLARDTDLTFREVTVHDVAGDGSGGAVQLGGGKLVVEGSTFRTNAALHGGAVFAGHADVRISGSTFTGNGASGGGGALFLTFPTAVAIGGTTFEGNSATGDGGAVYLEGSSGSGREALAISGTFDGNVSLARGGALFVRRTGDGARDRRVAIGESTFAGNRAAVGGAIAVDVGDVVVSGSGFEANEATRGDGGAIAAGGTLSVEAVELTGNWAFGSGGAVAALGGLRIAGSKVVDNRAGAWGGGLALTGPSTPEVRSTTLQGNVAELGGGAIARIGGELVEQENRLDGNGPAGDEVRVVEAAPLDLAVASAAVDEAEVPGRLAVVVGAVVLLLLVLVAWMTLRRRRRRALASAALAP